MALIFNLRILDSEYKRIFSWLRSKDYLVKTRNFQILWNLIYNCLRRDSSRLVVIENFSIGNENSELLEVKNSELLGTINSTLIRTQEGRIKSRQDAAVRSVNFLTELVEQQSWELELMG